MNVELRPLAEIRPYEKNPRINDAAVDAVAESIRRFGFRQPIVVDGDGVIVCGHTRWKAAQKLGLKQVPVHVARDLTPEQIRAYRIADNKTAELAEWNLDLLPIELAELQGAGVDWSLLGFDTDELAKLLDPGVQQGLTDPDEIPEPPDEAITQPGDLWVLGDHRLLCGDSSKPEDVDRLLGGQPIHLVNTDPPYNVRVEPRSNNAIAAGLSSFQATEAARRDGNMTHHQGFDLARDPEKAKATTRKLRPKDRPLANDFVSDEEFDRLLHAWFGNIARVLSPGRAAYIWGGYANCANYPPVLKACGLYFSQAIIWDKEHPVLTRKDFMGAHEWCFYTWREGAAPRLPGAEQRDRPLARQKGEPSIDDPPDGKAGRTGGPGHAVLVARWGERAGSVRRLGFNANRRGADRATGIPHGARSAVLRCNLPTLSQVRGEIRCAGDRQWKHTPRRSAYDAPPSRRCVSSTWTAAEFTRRVAATVTGSGSASAWRVGRHSAENLAASCVRPSVDAFTGHAPGCGARYAAPNSRPDT